MRIFYLAVLNALRMPLLINAQNPSRLPVSILAFVAMLTTAWIASTVDVFKEDLRVCLDHLCEDLVRHPVDSQRCVCLELSTRSF